MARILVAAVPTPGHVIPMQVIAAHLRRAGHQITFLGGRKFAAELTADGHAFETLPPEVDYDYANPVFKAPASSRLAGEAVAYNDLEQGSDAMLLVMEELFAPSVGPMHAAIMEIVARQPVDLILADSMFTGVLGLLCDERPAPVVIIGVTPFALDTPDAYLFGPRLPPALLPASLRGRSLRSAAEEAGLSRVHAAFASAVEKATGKTLPHTFHDQLIRGSDAFLQLSVPGFEFERVDAPAHVKLVGALPGRAAVPDAAPWPDQWQGREAQPLVVVSQGTLANHDLQQVLGPALAGLADLPVRVLATTGGRAADDLPTTPNGWVRPYAPFDQWLPRAAVLVTNGGYGGVHLALRSGVPLIVAGDGEDKQEVGVRVAFAGCGIDLRTGRPSAADVRSAVLRVLEIPRYAARAAELSEQCAAANALHHIEETVRRLVDQP